MLREAGCAAPLRASLELVELMNGRMFLWIPVAPRGKAWTRLMDVLGPHVAERLQSAYSGRGIEMATADSHYCRKNAKRNHIERIIGADAASKLFARFGGDWLDVPAPLDDRRDRGETRRAAVEMRGASRRISEIAARLHVSRRTIFRWLPGKRSPRTALTACPVSASRLPS
jgi:hypothetical protein